MSDITTKIKSWYQNLSSSKISFERNGIKPTRDWNIVIFSALLLIFASGALAFYFYIKVESGTYFSTITAEDLKEVKINNKVLDKLIADINVREKKLEEIQTNKNFPPNPSL
jgi:hypothetical protein